MSEGILPDTVTFVEHLQGTLPVSVQQTIEQAPRRFLSVTTPWEIHMRKVLRERIRPMAITAAIEQIGLKSKPFCLRKQFRTDNEPDKRT